MTIAHQKYVTVEPATVGRYLADDGWAASQKCLTGDTRVLTDGGWRPARFVKVGDRVLASDGRWRPVEQVHVRQAETADRAVTVRTGCTPAPHLTTDHRVLTVDGWKQAGDLVASHTPRGSSLTRRRVADWLVVPRPVLDATPVPCMLTLEAGHGYSKAVEMDEGFWWLVGQWVADGSAASSHGSKITGRVAFACAASDPATSERVAKELARLDLDVRAHETHGVKNVYATDLPFARWLVGNFRPLTPHGHRATAHHKSLPAWIDGLDDERWAAFWAGYMAGDGHRYADGSWTATTVSPSLAAALWRQHLGRGTFVSTNRVKTSWTYQGERNSGEAWEIRSHGSSDWAKPHETGWAVAVRSVERHQLQNQRLYDFTVAEVHDFSVGFTVHNCDGVGTLVVVDGGVRFQNTGGSALSTVVPGGRNLPAIAAALGRLPGRWVFAGELLADGTLWVYDAPFGRAGHVVVDPATPYDDRRVVLESLAPLVGWEDEGSPVRLVPVAYSADDKAALWAQVEASGAEGIVCNRLDARWRSGKRVDHVVKVKRVRTLDAIVLGPREGKDSVSLGLVRDGALVEVGHVSTIGKAVPATGSVIEVTALYAGVNGRLVQARIARPRPDKQAHECGWDQMDALRTSKAVLA